MLCHLQWHLTLGVVICLCPQRVVGRLAKGTKSITRPLVPPRTTLGKNLRFTLNMNQTPTRQSLISQMSTASYILMSFPLPAWLCVEQCSFFYFPTKHSHVSS